MPQLCVIGVAVVELGTIQSYIIACIGTIARNRVATWEISGIDVVTGVLVSGILVGLVGRCVGISMFIPDFTLLA